MKHTKPIHTPDRVDEAGKKIISSDTDPIAYTNALDVIENWRKSHQYPLHVFYMWFRRNAPRKDDVAERLKRFTSIRKKLIKYDKKIGLKLSEMQDIGGCRIVVADVPAVYKLAKKYKTSNVRHILDDENDYIKEPKRGYRSLHLIYRYNSDKKYQFYNGHKIEIQIRTLAQHAWATAVEAVDKFTEQSLKTSEGNPTWDRFFRLVSCVIAKLEDCKPIPKTPTDNKTLRAELSAFSDQIAVVANLLDYGQAIKALGDKSPKGDSYYLITLDIDAKTTSIKSFPKSLFEEAYKEYIGIERSISDRSKRDCILVSAKSVASLERLYPNYFLDIGVFNRILSDFLSGKILP